MKRAVAFLLAALLFVSTGSVFAQVAEDEDPPEALDPQLPIAQLKLNDQQKKQVEQIRFEMQKQMVGVRAKMQTARLEMRQLLNADSPDKAAIEKKMSEVAQIGVQIHSLRLNNWFEVNKILTPEQQKVWKGVLEHPFRARVKAWMSRRFRDGGCPCGPGHMMEGRRGPRPMEHRMMMHEPAPEKK